MEMLRWKNVSKHRNPQEPHRKKLIKKGQCVLFSFSKRKKNKKKLTKS